MSVLPSGPATKGVAIVPDTPFPLSRGIWVGTGGSLVVTWQDGTTSTFTNVGSGTLLPIAITNVGAASTASGLLRLT